MRALSVSLVLLVSAAVSGVAIAADMTTGSAGPLAASASNPPVATVVVPAASSALGTLLSRPVVLNGLLGDASIQVYLHPKTDEKESVEGTYFFLGQPKQILLAGEFEQDDLVMEESANGRDVSGQWQGKLTGTTLSGTWTSDDGDVSKPFVLTAEERRPASSLPLPGIRRKYTPGQ
ncbi:hypothetical protein RGU70_09560 [Herbaspirillum sp. RTI4]|uniref:hypothetical protein n=1 Tax=Herbaspirillum sp. RTI4 TaxID=3048640 RepID=UPI002AB385FC|nr:hypothetical protein [Herbaspirillum sp. RTI4]MDY7578569.1 hypothetical protein [Herbaspirillum sp. RTI4]MEA9981125.1 hypothetical protein [Herbaspirillum sp. RTI4]